MDELTITFEGCFHMPLQQDVYFNGIKRGIIYKHKIDFARNETSIRIELNDSGREMVESGICNL